MKARAAVLWGLDQPWKVQEIDVDDPKRGEVLVRWKAAGLCHSDEHLVTGDMVPSPEMLERWASTRSSRSSAATRAPASSRPSGPRCARWQVGDHVSASFVPSCGHCRYCTTGRGNLCNAGAGTLGGGMITDGTHRHFVDGQPVTLLAKLGTFAELTCVSEMSVIKVDDDLPLDCVSLVSCGVATGWGSATRRADVQVGDTVVVVGIGGIGINAVQGAKMAGAGRVDRRRPARVQAGEGDGVRRHPHVRLDGGGAPRGHRR